MDVFLSNITVTFDPNNSDRLTEEWSWLIGSDMKVLLVSAIGDLFLSDHHERVFWLDTGLGRLEIVAANHHDFVKKIANPEQVRDWFMIDLLEALRISNKLLHDGQVYSYMKLPVIGGEYSVDNFVPMDMVAHFSFTGQMHKQIKDLPDGTSVRVGFRE